MKMCDIILTMKVDWRKATRSRIDLEYRELSPQGFRQSLFQLHGLQMKSQYLITRRAVEFGHQAHLTGKTILSISNRHSQVP